MTGTVTFSVCSFNINGTKDKDYSINQKMIDFDIVLLQEHLLPAVSVSSLNRSDEHVVYTTSARRTRGRPSGGLACIVSNRLSCFSPQCIHSCDNFIALRIADLVIINTYLPHDKKTVLSFNKFTKIVSSLKNFLRNIERHSFKWIIVGDLNCNINRESTRSDLVLQSLPDGYQIVAKSADFSYIHNSGCVSDIDHCVCSAGVICSSVEVHDEERDYDHLPLSFTVSVSHSSGLNQCESSVRGTKWYNKREWNKANWTLYICTLATLLSSVTVPYHLLCTSVLSPNARSQLNSYYSQIVACLKQAEAIAVPVSRIRSKTRSSLWKEDPQLKIVKNRAKMWLRIWNACGRPTSGHVFNIKRKTKSEFKSYLRSVRYKGKEFPKSPRQWSEVLNSSKLNPTVSSSLIPGDSWVSHYSTIFSTVNYAVHSRFCRLLDSVIPRRLRQKDIIPISAESVVKSIKKLKSKSVDLDGICVEHLRIDSPELISHLQLLFQMCVSSSLVPDSFLCGTVTSVLKRGKDPLNCGSYRPITVACNLSKLFEYVLLPFIQDKVDYDANQFGFKSRIGCQHAHRILAKVLQEAHRLKTEVHFCALDLSKAFDTVCHSQAWFSLARLGVNSSIICVLRFWYQNSFIQLRQGSRAFGKIPVRSGVRQGSVLSPHIFKACLLSVLNMIPLSYSSGLSNVSYIAYADDLLLVSRSKFTLMKSVLLVSRLYGEIGLSLNTDKCEYLVFNSKSSATPLDCGVFSVKSVESFRWLGINICKSLTLFRFRALSDIKDKLKLGYAKIVPNRGRYNRKALAKLYSSFCDHAVLFPAGLHILFRPGDISDIRIMYFRYCKFLLYLPRRYSNRKMMRIFGAPDIVNCFVRQSSRLQENIYATLGVNHPLIRVATAH